MKTEKNTKTASIKIAGLELSLGNSKLPITTAVFNMGPATQCKSDKLNLCPFGSNSTNKELKGKCYALKAERLYPNALAMRKRQQNFWLNTNVETIISYIGIALQTGKHGKNMNAIRFNESGDFHSFECLTKLIKIAKAFPQLSIYTYTHRKDIMRHISNNSLPENLCINLSYPNNKKGFNTFCLDTQYGKDIKTITCTQCFKGCTLCHKAKNLNISVSVH